MPAIGVACGTEIFMTAIGKHQYNLVPCVVIQQTKIRRQMKHSPLKEQYYSGIRVYARTNFKAHSINTGLIHFFLFHEVKITGTGSRNVRGTCLSETKQHFTELNQLSLGAHAYEVDTPTAEDSGSLPFLMCSYFVITRRCIPGISLAANCLFQVMLPNLSRQVLFKASRKEMLFSSSHPQSLFRTHEHRYEAEI
ncbi:hypothetical protein CEXT_342081 [Caerostris extrusa]|uniref:Ribosomal protein L5 n=1 Tax=Caerostris extrusa TaxID=172846 RepID=A0AAV4X6D9_CAEEX|nr:hypothetical protein CEXT_342081 [Caerostris extrusa]